MSDKQEQKPNQEGTSQGTSQGKASSEMMRTSVDIPREVNDAMQRNIPWGFRNQVYQRLLEQFMKDVDKHGRLALFDVIDGKFSINYHSLGQGSTPDKSQPG